MNEKNEKSVGERLKLIRQKLMLSQQDLANILNVNQKTISHWEQARNEPSIKALRTLCSKFNINLNWLLTGEGEMFKEDKKTRIKKELYGDILKDAGYDLEDPDIKLILEELSRSPSAKKLLAKLIRAKRGDSKSLSEISLILEGLKMAHE